jgi:hypothetical protein
VSQLEAAKDAIAAAQDKQSRQANKRRRPVQIKTGDWVLVDSEALRLLSERDKPTRKTRALLAGPFRVREQIGNNSFRIDLPGSSRAHDVFNVSKLTLYWTSPDCFALRPEPTVSSWEEGGETLRNGQHSSLTMSKARSATILGITALRNLFLPRPRINLGGQLFGRVGM